MTHGKWVMEAQQDGWQGKGRMGHEDKAEWETGYSRTGHELEEDILKL